MSGKNKVMGGGHSPLPCSHDGDPVKIGRSTIYAGGGMYLSPETMARYELRVFLRAERNSENFAFGHTARGFLWLPIVDYLTVQEHDWAVWKVRLQQVYGQMQQGKRVIVFCAGGHGRTGLFLASLLALAEPDINDPVAEIRHRYCDKAVETSEQAAQVLRFLRETRATRVAETMKG